MLPVKSRFELLAAGQTAGTIQNRNCDLFSVNAIAGEVVEGLLDGTDTVDEDLEDESDSQSSLHSFVNVETVN